MSAIKNIVLFSKTKDKSVKELIKFIKNGNKSSSKILQDEVIVTKQLAKAFIITNGTDDLLDYFSIKTPKELKGLKVWCYVTEQMDRLKPNKWSEETKTFWSDLLKHMSKFDCSEITVAIIDDSGDGFWKNAKFIKDWTGKKY